MKAFFLRMSLLVLVLSFIEGVVFTTYYYFGWFYLNEDYVAEQYTGAYILAGRFLDSGGSIEELENLYATQVEIVAVDSLTPNTQENLRNGKISIDPVSLGSGYGRVVAPMTDPTLALGFAPFPYVPGDFLVLVTISLLIAMVAMLLFQRVLRPVAQELNQVEEGAQKIAAGLWNSRILPMKTPVAAPLAVAFNQMAEVTSSTIRAQQELLRVVSHELRTPMARLQLAFHLLASDDSPPGRQDRARKIDLEFTRIDRMIEELLTWSEASATLGNDELSSHFDLREVMETLTLARFDWAASRSLNLVISKVPAIQLPGNVRLFDRALGNLLDNAIRHAHTRVHVNLAVGEHGLDILVDDDGPGIAPEDRERVFQPFVRLAAPVGQEGFGLGLAITRGIVQRHGGRVWFEDAMPGCRAHMIWPKVPAGNPHPKAES